MKSLKSKNSTTVCTTSKCVSPRLLLFFVCLYLFLITFARFVKHVDTSQKAISSSPNAKKHTPEVPFFYRQLFFRKKKEKK